MFDCYKKYPVYCLHLVEEKNRLNNINNLKQNYFIFKDTVIYNFTKLKINNIIAEKLETLKSGYYETYKNSYLDLYGNVFSCAYNWLQIIKCSYEMGDEYAIFIEDDLSFKNHVDNEYIEQLIKDIPENADVVKFCTHPKPINSCNIELSTKFFNKIYLNDNTQQYIVDCNNSFFMLSRKAMKFYIDSQENCFGCSDYNINFDTHTLNVYMHKNYRDFCLYKLPSTIMIKK